MTIAKNSIHILGISFGETPNARGRLLNYFKTSSKVDMSTSAENKEKWNSLNWFNVEVPIVQLYVVVSRVDWIDSGSCLQFINDFWSILSGMFCCESMIDANFNLSINICDVWDRIIERWLYQLTFNLTTIVSIKLNFGMSEICFYERFLLEFVLRATIRVIENFLIIHVSLSWMTRQAEKHE